MIENNRIFSNIKAIIFDFDGTLVDEENWIRERWKKTILYVERELGLHNFGKKFWQKYYEKGPKFKYHVNECLEELCSDLKYLPDIVNKFLSERADEILLSGVPEALYQLSINYKLGIVTNGQQKIQLERIKNAGIFEYFEAIVCAFLEPKPSQNPYLECLSKLNVEPKETIYVGNDPNIDFKAPVQLEMISIFYNPKNENHPIHVNYHIRSFEELLKLLNCEANG